MNYGYFFLSTAMDLVKVIKLTEAGLEFLTWEMIISKMALYSILFYSIPFYSPKTISG